MAIDSPRALRGCRRAVVAAVLACAAPWAGCDRRAEPPPREPPRVYEPGDCGAVMALPAMTPDEVVEGVVTVGIAAARNRARAAAAWNRAHRGHWVRWSVVVRDRDADMRARGLVLASCPDRRASLMLQGTTDSAGALLLRTQGGERLRVVGWLDEWGIVLATTLHVESAEVEAASP